MKTHRMTNGDLKALQEALKEEPETNWGLNPDYYKIDLKLKNGIIVAQTTLNTPIVGKKILNRLQVRKGDYGNVLLLSSEEDNLNETELKDEEELVDMILYKIRESLFDNNLKLIDDALIVVCDTCKYRYELNLDYHEGDFFWSYKGKELFRATPIKTSLFIVEGGVCHDYLWVVRELLFRCELLERYGDFVPPPCKN